MALQLQSLKRKTITGITWSFIENIANTGIRFLIGVVLARFLNPPEYGILGLITVFLSISTSFINSGFGSALIRKLDRTESDISTVFYFNIIISLICYFVLFIFAPAIAKFYNQPILVPVTRVLGLYLIISALGMIQTTILVINLNFKTTAKVSLISNVLGGITGIILAYNGYGVWALVAQMLVTCFINTTLLWFSSSWSPLAGFSKKSFDELFSYGSKLLLSSLLANGCNNIRPIIIGKLFSPSALGLYTRSKSYTDLPSTNLTDIIQRVSFPVLSQMQGNENGLAENYRKLLKMSAFIIFACMMLLFGIADPLVRWMITDKWADCIPLLQIICFSSMWYPIHAINLNLLQVKGRSDLFLKLEIIKQTINLGIIFASAHWGIIGMCVGGIISSLLSLFVNTWYTGKIIHLGFFKQIIDIAPIFIISVISGVLALFSTFIHLNSHFVRIIYGSVVFFCSFLLLCLVTRSNELKEILKIIACQKKILLKK